MKSYTTLRNLYGSLTNNTQSDNLTLGDQMINDSLRTIYNLRSGKWWFLENTETVATVANQEGYQVPANIRKIVDLRIEVGNIVYMPEAIYDPDKWKLVLAYRLGVSDVPYFYYREGNQVLITPKPATSGNSIIFRGRKLTADLNQADYTTGTITSLTSGAKAIVGNGTTWTTGMIGNFIRITPTAAAGGGDGLWYEIADVTSTTGITLTKPYEGTTLAAATAAYTIGQMSLIPEAYDVAPVYRAVALYWMNNGDLNKAKAYWMMYDGGVEGGFTQTYGGLIGQMLENEGDKTREGAYIAPFGSLYNVINPNYPQPTASGF